MKEVVLPGAIKKLHFPDGWLSLFSPPDKGEFPEARWVRTFVSMFDEGVEITAYYRGMPVDEKSASFLRQLLFDKSALNVPEKLVLQEIVGLQVVMGMSNAGNNQYTNPELKGSPTGPVFDLKVALTRYVAGRIVLFVKGEFRTGRHFAGIFFDADKSGQQIEEFMIQAPSSNKLQKSMDQFDKILSSIEWQDPNAPRDSQALDATAPQ